MNLKPEELVKVLRDCAVYHGVLCNELGCEFANEGAGVCRDVLEFTAAELIERMEKEKAELINTIRGFCRHCKNVDVDENCCRAWVGCSTCSKECPCAGCRKGSKWEWKGLEDAL